jgi:transposase
MDWTDWESKYHGKLGKPPIHPSVLCKTLLYSLIRRVRSSRAIEYQVKHSIDFMWLTSGRTIDHVTLSNFRRAHHAQLGNIYSQMIKLAVDLGVAKLSELCIDGTRVLANANRFKTWTAERVEQLMKDLDAQIAQAFSGLETADQLDDLLDDGQSADKLPPELSDMQARRTQLDELLQKLNKMNAERKANGIDPQKNPAQLPKTDSDSRILPNKTGGYAPNYTPMAVTECMSGFIVWPEVMIGNVEHQCMTTAIDTIELQYGVKVETMMADTAYSTGQNLTAMEARGTELLSPVAGVKTPDNPALRDDLTQPVAEEDVARLPVNPQTKRFDKSAFVYDPETNSYYCPAGKQLPQTGTEKTRARGTTPAGTQATYTCGGCAGCGLGPSCRADVEAKKGRKVVRDENEFARERQRERMNQPEAKERYRRRQHIGETPFAALKSALDFRQFLLRGIEGVQVEWAWGCAAFNTKKLINILATLRAQQTEKLEMTMN